MLSEIPYHVDFIVCRSYWFCKGLKLEISIYTIKRVAEVLAGYPKLRAKNRKGKLGACLVMKFKNCYLKLRTEKIKLIYTITEKYQHTNNSNIVYT